MEKKHTKPENKLISIFSSNSVRVHFDSDWPKVLSNFADFLRQLSEHPLSSYPCLFRIFLQYSKHGSISGINFKANVITESAAWWRMLGTLPPYSSRPQPDTMPTRPRKSPASLRGMQMGTTWGWRSMGSSSSRMARSFSKVGAL